MARITFGEEQMKWFRENYDKVELKVLREKLNVGSSVIYRLIEENGLKRIRKAQPRMVDKSLRDEDGNWEYKMNEAYQLTQKQAQARKIAQEKGKIGKYKVIQIHKHFCLLQHPNGYKECFLWSDLAQMI